MAEPLPSPWRWRAVYLGLFGCVMWLRLLPFGPGGTVVPWPDVMLVVTAAWVLRRPESLPAPLIAAVFLAEDLFLMRPPGLWAACALLLAEFLRSRAALLRALPFPAEWLLVALAIAGAAVLHRVILALTLTPGPDLGGAAVQAVATVLAYPLAVAALQFGLGLRKPATGELDAMGRRL